MCFQKIREGVEKVTSSWGGVLVKMMVDGRGGVKSPNWGVHGPIYLNMTLSYRNNAGIVVCLYQYI